MGLRYALALWPACCNAGCGILLIFDDFYLFYFCNCTEMNFINSNYYICLFCLPFFPGFGRSVEKVATWQSGCT